MFKRIASIVVAILSLTVLSTPAQAATINLTLDCTTSAAERHQYVTGGDVLVYTVTNADTISDRWPAGTSYALVSGGSSVASGSIQSDTTTSFNNLNTSNT